MDELRAVLDAAGVDCGWLLGLSEGEIAASLRISPRTVENHLTRAYSKLGVRSRTELALLSST